MQLDKTLNIIQTLAIITSIQCFCSEVGHWQCYLRYAGGFRFKYKEWPRTSPETCIQMSFKRKTIIIFVLLFSFK